MSGAARVRRGRLAAVVTASLVTTTAVVGAVTGAGNPPPASASPATATLSAAEQGLGPGRTGSEAAAHAQRRFHDQQEVAGLDVETPALPPRSGEGRRVVFDMSEQQVWLVRANGTVARSYPVSGSIYDNLDPGTYAVYSRSEQAWAFDGSGSMRWMVRFTQGDNAAIGFHDIPVEDGERAQTREELGTPQSHGCIRQWPDDAKALWRFAPVGTTVVVTA
jgi:hypothetical protein